MAKYMYIYHGGGMPETPEEGAKVMAAWEAWYGKLGVNLVDGGGPVGQSYTVSADSVFDNGGPNPVSGYTVVDAPDLESALKWAAECPMVADGSGTAEVAPIMDM